MEMRQGGGRHGLPEAPHSWVEEVGEGDLDTAATLINTATPAAVTAFTAWRNGSASNSTNSSIASTRETKNHPNHTGRCVQSAENEDLESAHSSTTIMKEMPFLVHAESESVAKAARALISCDEMTTEEKEQGLKSLLNKKSWSDYQRWKCAKEKKRLLLNVLMLFPEEGAIRWTELEAKYAEKHSSNLRDDLVGLYGEDEAELSCLTDLSDFNVSFGHFEHVLYLSSVDDLKRQEGAFEDHVKKMKALASKRDKTKTWNWLAQLKVAALGVTNLGKMVPNQYAGFAGDDKMKYTKIPKKLVQKANDVFLVCDTQTASDLARAEIILEALGNDAM